MLGLADGPARAFARALATIALCGPLIAAATGNVIQLQYDPAGNITNLTRQSSPGFAITSFDPASGPVGSAVTIYGAGFSPTPASNTVKFDGVTATVTASTTGSLSTTVPTGATTGRITVTVAGSTATSATDFVVTIAGAPTITSFTPGSALAGGSVSVAGTNFDPAPGATTVKLNGVTASANVSSSTGLTFIVPGAAASGRITATTASGTGSSISDFIVPPAGVDSTAIASAVRVTPDDVANNLRLMTPNTHGLVLFDGVADGYYTLQFGELAITPSSSTVPYTVVKPDNSTLPAGYVATDNNSYRPSIHLPKLTAAGTWSILLSPGLATFNTNVKVVSNPVLALDGAAVPFSLGWRAQTVRFAFDATAGQSLSLGVPGISYAGGTTTANTSVVVHKPDGTTLSTGAESCSPSATPGCKVTLAALPASGRYTATVIGPVASALAGVALASSDLTGTFVPGTPLAFNASRAGQNARLPFAGNAGDVAVVKMYGASVVPTSQVIQLKAYRPDGSLMTSTTVSGTASQGLARLAFATTGTYSLVIEPRYASTWQGTVALDLGAVVTVNGTMPTLSSAAAGAQLVYRFTGTAGQRSEWGASGLAYAAASGSSTALAIFDPNGNQVASTSCYTTGPCRAFHASLPASGTYLAVFTPPAASSIIAGSFAASTPVTGSFVVNDPAQSLSVSRPGQTARYTFSGTAAQLLRVTWAAATTSGGNVSVTVHKPDGSILSSGSFANGATGGLDIASLPTTGTYTIAFDPLGHTMSTSSSLVTR